MQVYLITNKVNGKKYVGQTIQTLKKRWSSHGSDAKRNRGPHALVHALLKYGKENFTIRTLTVCRTREELNRLEKKYIVKLKTKTPNGYNIADGGDGTAGVPYTASQLKKFRKTIGNSRKGSGNSFFGMKHSAHSKSKMRKAKLGKPAPWKAGWKHGTSYAYGKKNCRCEICRKFKHDSYVKKFGIKTKEETRRKLSESHKGIPAWNKGTAKGVYWDKEADKWTVVLWIKGKTKKFGRFTKKEEANVLALKLKGELYGTRSK
jgi:group I intron endonuclease